LDRGDHLCGIIDLDMAFGSPVSKPCAFPHDTIVPQRLALRPGDSVFVVG
jgi:hypothetical protein